MRLYNTLSRTKEEFFPTNNKVNIYTCGITVYDLCHIGHARSAIVFDILVRYFRHKGYDVTFIRNFTDVDDKIVRRANEEGISPEEVADKYIRAFHEDMSTLKVLPADIEPKCTEHIAEMVTFIEKLIKADKAYSSPCGDVYFRVRSFADYGKLSGRNIEDMIAGARIEIGEEKEDPLDFTLWKSTKPNEPFWESPWGKGRPGWHIECSAMCEKYVPLPLDIHGGGQDLIFPHHENEIAQSEACGENLLARFWVHNGFVQINSEKMSKSLGNFFTIRDILKSFLPEVLRYFLLTIHYRSPLDFSFDALEDAEKGIRRIYTAIGSIEERLAQDSWTDTAIPEEFEQELDQIENNFTIAMEDDLNTANALGQIFTMLRLAGRLDENKKLQKSKFAKEIFERILTNMKNWSPLFAIFETTPQDFLTSLKDSKILRKNINTEEIEQILAKRATARIEKDFAQSDALRDVLLGKEIIVKDTANGQTWDIV